MSRLLSANFSRLWKSRSFWIETVLVGTAVLCLCADHYYIMGKETILDGFILGYAMIAGAPTAVFCGLFLGVDYGDGTIRNKLIAGHSRREIYLSNLITVFAVSVLFSLAWVAVSLSVGIPLFGGLKSDWQVLLILSLESLLVLAAFSAVFTMAGMLLQNKAASATACILLTVVLYYMMTEINIGLKTSEYYYVALSVSEEGEIRETNEWRSNPGYIRGTKRKVYEFLYDFLPSCQGLQIANMFAEHPAHPVRMPLYSLAVTVSVTAGGIFLFSRKDIK